MQQLPSSPQFAWLCHRRCVFPTCVTVVPDSYFCDILCRLEEVVPEGECGGSESLNHLIFSWCYNIAWQTVTHIGCDLSRIMEIWDLRLDGRESSWHLDTSIHTISLEDPPAKQRLVKTQVNSYFPNSLLKEVASSLLPICVKGTFW